MADRLTPRERSALMRRVKARGTGPEKRLEAALRARGATGWIRHAKLPGSPDLAWRGARLAVFVHGCFWHGCPLHYRPPATSFRHAPTFWADKLLRNRRRDRRARAALRAAGWTAIVVWEHDAPAAAALRIQRALAKPGASKKAQAHRWTCGPRPKSSAAPSATGPSARRSPRTDSTSAPRRATTSRTTTSTSAPSTRPSRAAATRGGT